MILTYKRIKRTASGTYNCPFKIRSRWEHTTYPYWIKVNVN